MSCLAPLCLLTLIWTHYVYAQFSPAEPSGMDAFQPFHIFNPITGKKLVPARFLDFGKVSNNLIELPKLGLPCSCQDFTCQCCLGLGFGAMKQSLCVLVRYTWRDLNVQFAVELNQRTVTGFNISPRNLPDFCTPLALPIPAFACLRLYDIHVTEKSLNVCISVVFKMLFQQLFEYKLNCLDLSFRGVAIADGYDWSEEKLRKRQSQSQELAEVYWPSNKLERFVV